MRGEGKGREERGGEDKGGLPSRPRRPRKPDTPRSRPPTGVAPDGGVGEGAPLLVVLRPHLGPALQQQLHHRGMAWGGPGGWEGGARQGRGAAWARVLARSVPGRLLAGGSARLYAFVLRVASQRMEAVAHAAQGSVRALRALRALRASKHARKQARAVCPPPLLLAQCRAVQ